MPIGGVIDLDRELEDIFEKEEMRAFFDLQIALAGDRTASGLCKISEPKKHESGSTYFSLLFLIDVPDQNTRTEIDAVMAKVEWSRLQKYLGHVESVMSLPLRKPIEGIYLRETYVYVSAPHVFETAYLTDIFYPAIRKIMGFTAGDLVVWNDETSGSGASGAPVSGGKPLPPFLERLRRFLK
jgi:hypothetical protein